MKPSRAASITSVLMSWPVIAAASTMGGAALAQSPEGARAIAETAPMALQAAATSPVPVWLLPYLPTIIGAVSGFGAAAMMWVLRTVFGVSIAALSAALYAGADAVELKARKTKDPGDDAPASALAAAMRAAALRLEASEHDIPTKKGGK